MAYPTVGYRGKRLDLLIRQGADFIITASMQNPDGSATDLTGCEIRGQIRKNALDEEVVEDFTVTVTDAEAGLYELSIANVDTAAIPCGETIESTDSKYVWDLELEDADGKVVPLYFGNVIVFREVTRA